MFLKVRSSLGVLYGADSLPIFRNMYEVLEYISANHLLPSRQVICLVKQIYDDNLPNLFRYIKSDSGLCGYWAYNYYRLYKSLGFDTDLYVLLNDKPVHYFIRVGVSCSNFVDIDRGFCACVVHNTSALIHSWSSHAKGRALRLSKIVPSSNWVLNYERVSRKTLSYSLSSELSAYTNAILTNIHSYNPKRFTDLSTYDFSILIGRKNH